MANFRKVTTRIWTNKPFIGLSERAQLVFLNIITNQHMTSLGVMAEPLEALAARLKSGGKPMPVTRYRKAFRELEDAGRIEYDHDMHVLAIPNHFEHNAPDSHKNVKSIVSHAANMPASPVITRQLLRLKDLVSKKGEEWTDPIDGALHGAPDGASMGHAMQGEGEGEGKGDVEGEGIDCAEQSASGRPTLPPVFLLPVKGQDKTWPLSVEDFEVYVNDFDTLDVYDQFKRMRNWLLSNPTKKKTPQGMKSFINRWLSKALNFPQKEQPRPLSERVSIYRRYFPDWSDKKLARAAMTGPELAAAERSRIERDEKRQEEERMAALRRKIQEEPLQVGNLFK